MATPIRGQTPLSAPDALAIVRRACPLDVRPADTAIYVQHMHTLCALFGLRLDVMLAQFLHETGNAGPAGRWRELNPAGLGITSAGDATPYRITDGTEAAALHVWSMLVALREWAATERIVLPPTSIGWVQRWTAKYRDAACPPVNNVEDLNTIYAGNRATWATDPAYHTKLLATMNTLFPATGESDKPMAIIFGRVPHPAFQDRPIQKPEGVGQNNLGKRSVKGVVWHRILGSLWGTDQYFRMDFVAALTDYGVGVHATDGVANDGLILRWNDPLGYQSGWASGPVNGAYGDGKAFVDKYGVNAVNRDQVSIEISGFQTTPLSEKSRQSIAALTAYYADQYGIPWSEFPIAPQDGFSFVRWHQEFTIGSGKECPFKVVMDETPALIERTRAILKAYQTSGPTVELPAEDTDPEPNDPEIPESSKHELPEGMTVELARRLYGSAVNPVTGEREGFDITKQPSQMWLAYVKRTKRKPSLLQIIRRGDGGQLYQWSDGFDWERRP